jgi:hypothetical protein
MTLDEANKVASLFDQADGGCDHCAYRLREEAQTVFPEFNWGPNQYDEVTLKVVDETT